MDNKGLVDIKELRKLKDKADFRGKSSYCFIRGDKLIKVYANDNDYSYISLDRHYVCDFSKFKADTIVFPDSYLYEDGERAGEIQKYINDVSIKSSFNDSTEIVPLINHYELVINDFMMFCNLLMCDLCYVNILYSKEKGFHIIDTSEWEIHNNGIDWYMKSNIHRFSSCIIKILFEYLDMPMTYYHNRALIDAIIVSNANKYGKIGEQFINVLCNNVDGKYRVVDLFYEYMNLYYKHYNKEMTSFKEMKELTKILKKG